MPLKIRRKGPKRPSPSRLDIMPVAEVRTWAESCLMNAHMCYDNYARFGDRDQIPVALDYLSGAKEALESLYGRNHG